MTDMTENCNGPSSRDAGRLQALKEKFNRQADRCQEQERYDAMDIWRNAAADVEQMQAKMELSKNEGGEAESTHWEVKYQDWGGVWRDYSDKGLTKRKRAKRVFEGYDDGAKLYRVEKYLVKES